MTEILGDACRTCSHLPIVQRHLNKQSSTVATTSYKVKRKGSFWKNREETESQPRNNSHHAVWQAWQWALQGYPGYLSRVFWSKRCLRWIFKDWRMQTAWPEGDTNFYHLYFCALNTAEVGHPLCLSCHCSVSDPSIYPGGLDVLWRLDVFWRWSWEVRCLLTRESPRLNSPLTKQLIQEILRNWSS